MIAARNRLIREKEKKRVMTQPHTLTPHQQIIQAHKELSIVKSIEIRTNESDTSTAANDTTNLVKNHHLNQRIIQP